MSVELACRLLENKVLLRTEVAASLLDASKRGIAFVQSIIERIPGATVLLESEFSRWPGKVQSSIRVNHDLIRKLPEGMCERLLALPLQSPESLQSVELAVVDPFDSHALAEFQFVLSVAVTPVRVAYSVLVAALGAVSAARRPGFDVQLEVPEDETPAFGTRMIRSIRPESLRPSTQARPRRGFTLPSVEAPERSSEPPIPLVRTTLAPERMRTPFPVEQTPLPGRLPRDSEPILRLVKQKPSVTTRRVSIPVPPKSSSEQPPQPDESLKALDTAQTPRRLIELLHEALRRVAPCQAFFSVRGHRFVLEWASGVQNVGEISLTAEQEAMFDKACSAGYSLGPLPGDGSARALGAALGLRTREEIYIAPISIGMRVALLIVVARFEDAFMATRWVDNVANRAGQALERIARSRKT